MAKCIKISPQKYTPSAIYNSKDALQKQMPNNRRLPLAITAQACDGIQAAIYKTSKNIY